jgi:indole-3-glycerol phosphate synthase
MMRKMKARSLPDLVNMAARLGITALSDFRSAHEAADVLLRVRDGASRMSGEQAH